MKDDINRRRFLQWVFTSVAVHQLRGASQDTPPRENFRDFNSGDIPDLQALGTKTALKEEIQIGDRILAETPNMSAPLDVFTSLERRPERNKDNEAYNGGWRDRWNPLIVRLFEQTHTKPSGDTTAWCAASLNWALARLGLRTTDSASSGSFRNAPGATDSPQAGDIVVFINRDPQQAAVGRGHVGLFIDRTGDEILVLGGNQKNTSGHHAFCRKPFKTSGASLAFHSFHAIDAFAKRP